MIRVKTQNALTLVIRYRSSLFISLGWEGVREGARGDLGGFQKLPDLLLSGLKIFPLCCSQFAVILIYIYMYIFLFN